jgi:hypothetical protein
MNRARRLLCVSVLLAAGCIPYAYPKLSYVPGVQTEPDTPDVHAFRVDLAAVNSFMTGETGEYTLAEITPVADGRVPAQSRLTFEHGYFLLFQFGNRHTTLVRLYRPGYWLVELNSWESPDQVSWNPTDWGGQVLALENLLDRPRLTPPSVPTAHRFREWPQAPTSPAEERARDFAAAEYERLAREAPTPEQAEKLREKAKKLIESKPAAPTKGSP